MINCKNCGASLDAKTNDIVKCRYCGTVYEKPEKATQSQNSTPQNTEITTTPPQQDSGNSGCGALFLIAIVIVVIAIYLNKESDGNSIKLVDSVAIDTSSIYPSTEDLYNYYSPKKVYIKKNSEKAVSVSGKVYHQLYAPVMSVSFKNHTLSDINRIKFSFKLFDKAGKELPTGDSNEREVSIGLYKGRSITEEGG